MPLKSWLMLTSPVDSPDSHSDIGRIVIHANRPVPV